MSGQSSEKPGLSGSEEAPFGWFAYLPPGVRDVDDEDTAIRRVTLRAHEHAGPFWDDEEHLSDDYDELHRWLGISRELYEDAMAWNEESVASITCNTAQWQRSHFQRKQELLRRLGKEIKPGIEVVSEG